MQVHYWVHREDGKITRMQRNSFRPDEGWERIPPQDAPSVARMLDDGSGRTSWVIMPIHEIDYHALLGDGWREFVFEPTEEQRQQCRVNHGGRELEDIAAKEGLRWEEIVAILTCQPWRRLIPMRAFTTARDWPLSVPR